MIFGHLTSALFIRGVTKWPPKRSELFTFLIGVYFPDLIDKPLYFLHLTTGRGMGHTLLLNTTVILVAGITLHLLKRSSGEKKLLIILAVGSVLHLFGDLISPTVLFWPLLGPFPPHQQVSLRMIIANFYRGDFGNPILIMELVSHLALSTYLLWRLWPKQLRRWK